MIEYKLNIGEVVVSKQPAVFTCLGLGSCIGLFLHDRQTGVSGGAHIFLPNANHTMTDSFHYTVTSAINEMLKQFQQYGSSLLNLRAKISGGASVLADVYDTGKNNIASVKEVLVANKVFIAAADVGGNRSRTARFCSLSGEMRVMIRETQECKIY